MMTDQRQHRGAHPEDHRLFTPDQLDALQQSVTDLSWLLTRGYAAVSALKLVGDRYKLTQRQRLATSRAACSDDHLLHSRRNLLQLDSISGAHVLVDGFNLIVTLEAALSGGLLLRCRDGCVRDLSSVHGSYRSVQETEAAISMLGDALMKHAPRQITWLLDQPVSNSGRLKQKILALAAERNWNWQVQLVMNPDEQLRQTDQIVATADSVILDEEVRWVNVTEWLLANRLGDAWVVDLRW